MPYKPVRTDLGEGKFVEELTFVFEPGDDLTPFKFNAINNIKNQAKTMIGALQWKIDRVTQREMLGTASLLDRATIYAEIESIRQSSNKAEETVNVLEDYDAIINFQWGIDVIVSVPKILTHVEFIKLFTKEEYENIVAAVETNSAIKASWNLFFLADYVNLSDQKTISGIMLLSEIGLLSSERASIILS